MLKSASRTFGAVVCALPLLSACNRSEGSERPTIADQDPLWSSYISYHTTYYGQGTFLKGLGTASGPLSLNRKQMDTAKWWKRLPYDTRENILRSVGADALMKTRTSWYKCPVCGGKGMLRTIGLTGGSATRTCSHCFGVRRFAKVVYW